MPRQLTKTTTDGRLRVHFHRGQWRAWESAKRIVLVLAGTQGGKTVFGPPWLWREIRGRGPGDYIGAAPTYPLMERKMLPEFLGLFQRTLQLGDYNASGRRFTFSPDGCRATFGHVPDVPTHVYFGHAQDPDSLEAATAKAAWLDEAGQRKFKVGSWEAIQRRLSIHQGRALLTTTPYDLGWLKQRLWDPWKAAGRNHPHIDVIRFESTENPAFPREEFERARASLPAWKFNLFYRAIFTRPAGLIYDAFDEAAHKVSRFPIPDNWPRCLGLDFGGVNTAGVFYAKELNGRGEETGRLLAYREYRAGRRTAREHAEALKRGEPMLTCCVGGSKGEGQWRDEFRAAGLFVREPAVTGADSVEVGINRVYGAHKRGELLVFDHLSGYLEEKLTYSRVLDDAGEPTEEIDDKSAFHFMDAERYVIGYVKGGFVPFGPAPPPERTIVDAGIAAGVWTRGDDNDWDENRDGIRWPAHF